MTIESLGSQSGSTSVAAAIPGADPVVPNSHATSAHPAQSTRWAQAHPPRLRLSTERLVVEAGNGWASELDEVEAPVIELSFDYGGHWVRASDPRERFFRAAGTGGAAGMSTVERDRASESRARYVLEGFGAVDLACLPEYGAPPDSHADYLVHPELDVHAICAFSAYAVPQLRAMGWQVEVDEAYPYRVVAGDTPWYADVGGEPERPDWFALELGVEVEGQRVNMLPVLLDLLERTPDETSLERLMRGHQRLFALPLEEGRYLAIPCERVRDVMRVLVELYQGPGRRTARLVAPLCHAGALERLDQVFAEVRPALRWHGDTQPREHGRKLRMSMPDALGDTNPPALPALRATLRPYQEIGVQWLQQLRTQGLGGVLADDMGLGKTLQIIAHLVAEKAAGRLELPALVVCPTSLVGNWVNELRRFAPELRVVPIHGAERRRAWPLLPSSEVVLTSYPVLVRDETRWLEHSFSSVILDEAHVIKNPRSQAHRAAGLIRAEHRLCLTGTPVENHLGELRALFEFMMPGFLGDEPRFRELYRVPIESRGDDERLAALRELVAPYILRRLKSEVARELPPKTMIVRPVALRGKQRDLYESIRMAAHADVRKTIRKKGFGSSTIAILDALMKLRQLCCDPKLLSLDAARFVRDSAKFELLMTLVAQQLEQGRRLLIFSQFTRMLSLISRGLESRSVGHVTLTGSTVHRQRPIDAFERGDVDVFLISLKAGGVGLNLTSADTVIHYDPWWNPAAQAQATDRAYRIGQKKPVFVYNLIVAGSVEERMLQLQRRKQHLAHTLLGEAGGCALAEHEVEALLAPLDIAEDSGE